MLTIQLPVDVAQIQLPSAVAARLQSLLDRLDADELSPDEKAEAEGLVELADLLTLLRLRVERSAS